MEIIPPFYAHLFAYFFNVVQPFPVPTIYVEDYHLDITRNMLDHASQISFECLVFLYSTFELEERHTDRGLGEMFETLLFHHIQMIDYDDKEEKNNFIEKVRILSVFNLERYVYYELNSVVTSELEHGKINREVFLLYAYSNMLFSSSYDYDKLLAYWLE